MNTETNNLTNTVSKIADKATKKGYEAANAAKDTLKKTGEGFEDMVESIDLDEISAQLKGYANAAYDFVKKRPALVITTACAIGLVGAWVLSSKRSNGKAKEVHT